jgi:hypothetical protein
MGKSTAIGHKVFQPNAAIQHFFFAVAQHLLALLVPNANGSLLAKRYNGRWKVADNPLNDRYFHFLLRQSNSFNDRTTRIPARDMNDASLATAVNRG